MANTFELIASQTISTNTSVVTLSSIPGTYTDLKLVMSIRTNRASIIDDMRVQLNGSVTSYTLRRLQGSGTAVSSFSDTTIYFTGAGGNASSSTFSNSEIYFPNYTSSNSKSSAIDSVTENNAANAYQEFDANLWANSAAITQISIDSWNSASIVAGSTFYLYGISNS